MTAPGSTSNSLAAAVRAYYGAGPPGTLSSLQAALRRRWGTVRQAARRAGVSESSWRRWARGAATPRPESYRRLEEAVWLAQIEDRRIPTPQLVIDYEQSQPRGRPRSRTVDGTALVMPPDIGTRMLPAIFMRDWDLAAKILAASIGDDVYVGFFTPQTPDTPWGELDSGSAYQIIVTRFRA